MQSIPLINLMAIAHVTCISVFFGIFLVESVIELYPYFNKYQDTELHHAAIRYHYWIDSVIEIPAVLGILGTGICMAILVDKLTILHVIKIGCIICWVTGGSLCILSVIKRYKLLNQDSSEEIIANKSKRIINIAATITYLFFIPALLIGAWLAYHRILESIY